MKVKIASIVVVAASVVFCAGLSAFGQSSVSVKYTGKYSTTWTDYGTTYAAGIYGATINGSPSASGMICDDFKDNTNSGETWTANVTQASSLTSSNIGKTLFGSSIGLDGYAEVATLVSMMFSGSTTYGTGKGSIAGITQAELASAIWDITTKGGISGLDTTAKALVAAVKAAFGTNTGKAETYLATLTNLWILTPTNLGPLEPQEMWTENLAVPEGGAALMYLLLTTLFCGWSFFLRNRERIHS